MGGGPLSCLPGNVENVFNSKSTKAQKAVNMEDITIQEFNKIEKCSNGGLINVDWSILEQEIQCYGYDFSAWYANILTNFNLKILYTLYSRICKEISTTI